MLDNHPFNIGCHLRCHLDFHLTLGVNALKAHFRLGPGSKLVGPIWTHLKQIESFELDHALDPSLHLGSPNHELSFELSFFFGSEPVDFPSKMVPCKFSLDLQLFGLGTR